MSTEINEVEENNEFKQLAKAKTLGNKVKNFLMRIPEVAYAGLALGFLQGLGVDHSCSFLPLMSTHSKSNILLGSLWGFSHSFGVLLVLAVLFSLKRLTPFVYPFAVADLLYSALLISIGSYTLYKLFRPPISDHSDHDHDESLSILEKQPVEKLEDEPISRKRLVVASSAGFFHGISGCGCALAAVPLLAVSAGSTLAFYAASLVLGAVLSSASAAAVLSFAVRTPESLRLVNALGGLLALGVGLFFALHSRQHRSELL